MTITCAAQAWKHLEAEDLEYNIAVALECSIEQHLRDRIIGFGKMPAIQSLTRPYNAH